MLRWVILVLFWGPFTLAADVCEDAVITNASVCREDLIDPVFQRAHATSPRTNVLIYDLSQACVNNIAECFDKCGDSRFRDGNRFEHILKLLRAPLGESLVTTKTKKCRENLNKYSKKIALICEKFKVHQSAAANVSDAKQRILSEHCSKFGLYNKPLEGDEDGVKKSNTDKEKKNKKTGKASNVPGIGAPTSSAELGSIKVGDGVSPTYEAVESADSVGGQKRPIEISTKGVRSAIGGGGRGDQAIEKPLPKTAKKKAARGKSGFVANSPSSFQPIDGQQKIKKKAKGRRGAPLKRQRDGLQGNNYHGTSQIPDPGSGQAVPTAAQGAPVSAAIVQKLNDRLMKKVSGGGSEELKSEPKDKKQSKGPSEVFNETKRTFRKLRRKNEFIE